MKKEDQRLVRLCQLGDANSQLQLWKKWEPFTQKQFFKARDTFVLAGVTFEDFMQEAYLAFLKTIQEFDFSKDCGFSTSYYFNLLKIRNASETELYRYGSIAYQSEFEEDGEYVLDPKKPDLCNPWNQATTGDIHRDYKEVQAVKILDVYFEEEKNPLYAKIVTFLLQGKNPGNIVHLLDDEYSYNKIRQMIDEIYEKIRIISERVAFEPIL